jgi:hypothetical protein
MRASGARMMVIETMLRPDVLILRHPDDCAAVSRDQEAFGKQVRPVGGRAGRVVTGVQSHAGGAAWLGFSHGSGLR